MAVFVLIRHATTDFVGRALAGRLPGVPLNALGKREAAQLAQRLSAAHLSAIFSSPLERTRETAECIGERLGMDVQLCDAFTEVDCGAWTGRQFTDMENEPKWHQFNLFRSGARIPGGEMMLEVQARIVVELERLWRQHPDGVMAVVTHADVIRAAVLYFAGVPIDHLLRIEISPASLTAVSLDDYGPRILCINSTGDLPRCLTE